MTTKEYEQQKARIRGLIDEWHAPLGLLWWSVEHVYYDDAGDFQEKEQAFNGSYIPGCLALTHASWEYMEASVHWNLPALLSLPTEEVEKVFVHECVHILLKETQATKTCDCSEWDMRHEERVCTLLTKAFLWTKERYKNGKLASPKRKTTLRKNRG